MIDNDTLRGLRKKYGRLPIIAKDEKPLAVIRSTNPQLAVQIAKIAFEKNDQALFARLPEEIGSDYKLVGWLAVAPKGCNYVLIVDGDGEILDTSEPGDSFVTLEDSLRE